MKKIDTNSGYDYTKLFDASKGKTLQREIIGRDEFGNKILHISSAGSTPSADEFYVLEPCEYNDYIEKARKNGKLSWFRYRKLLAENHDSNTPHGNITSFEIVKLHTIGMRYINDYEIVMKESEAEVSKYGNRYSGPEDIRIPEIQVTCSEKEVLKLLNDCKLLSWDGFYGKHPKGVRDGTMFRLEAVVNGSRKIHASGSQNFPRHYRDFTDGLYRLLHPSEPTE